MVCLGFVKFVCVVVSCGIQMICVLCVIFFSFLVVFIFVLVLLWVFVFFVCFIFKSLVIYYQGIILDNQDVILKEEILKFIWILVEIIDLEYYVLVDEYMDRFLYYFEDLVERRSEMDVEYFVCCF